LTQLPKLIALALALNAFPQGAPAASAAEAAGERRLRIILESETAPSEAAAPEVIDAAPLQPIAVAERYAVEPPPEWTEEAMRTPLMPGEGWRIQVGAFSEAARAEAAIAALETTAAGPGADPVRLVAPAGGLYRAQMSGFVDRAAADAACARIAAAGSGCFVVPPAH
jgi:cell division septation protein DedD